MQAKAANLQQIDALVPSRQVKFEAGARLRAILSRHSWLCVAPSFFYFVYFPFFVVF